LDFSQVHPVAKVGRTTRWTGGITNPAAAFMRYSPFKDMSLSPFQDKVALACAIVGRDNVPFMKGGDSGSIIILSRRRGADHSGAACAVELGFASDSVASYIMP
jgi:hypothetical protein